MHMLLFSFAREEDGFWFRDHDDLLALLSNEERKREREVS